MAGEAWERSNTQHVLGIDVAGLSLFKVVFNGTTNYCETAKIDEWQLRATPVYQRESPSQFNNEIDRQTDTQTVTLPENSLRLSNILMRAAIC